MIKKYQLELTDGELTLLRVAVKKAESAYRQDKDLFYSLMMENADVLLEHKVKEAQYVRSSDDV